MQLVSWPLRATTASSFHWNRWHAEVRKHTAIFIPGASKLTPRFHSSSIHHEIRVLKLCTSLTTGLLLVGLVGRWFVVVFFEGEYRTARTNTKAVPKKLDSDYSGHQAEEQEGLKYFPSFWKRTDLSTEEYPHWAQSKNLILPRPFDRQRRPSFQRHLPYMWTLCLLEGEGGKELQYFKK